MIIKKEYFKRGQLKSTKFMNTSLPGIEFNSQAKAQAAVFTERIDIED